MSQGEPHVAFRVGALVGLLTLAAAASGAEPEVRFDSGRLWVRAGGEIVARRLLRVIGERTGIEFVVDPELADRPLHLEIEGMELERALPQLVKAIPNAGGFTKSYVPTASGEARLARVNVFAVGRSPAPPLPSSDGGSAETVIIAAPTPSAEDFAAQEQHLIDSGVPAETARKFVDLTNEVQRVQRTPGASEALIRSEEYREVMREIGEAQGKGAPPEAEP